MPTAPTDAKAAAPAPAKAVAAPPPPASSASGTGAACCCVCVCADDAADAFGAFDRLSPPARLLTPVGCFSLVLISCRGDPRLPLGGGGLITWDAEEDAEEEEEEDADDDDDADDEYRRRRTDRSSNPMKLLEVPVDMVGIIISLRRRRMNGENLPDLCGSGV